MVLRTFTLPLDWQRYNQRVPKSPFIPQRDKAQRGNLANAASENKLVCSSGGKHKSSPFMERKNNSLLLFFHSCLLFSQTGGPRVLVVQLRHQRNQNGKLLERDRQLCSWDTGANFQSSEYCRIRCSGSFTQVRSCVWYLRNSCCGVNAVRESREKKNYYPYETEGSSERMTTN